MDTIDTLAIIGDSLTISYQQQSSIRSTTLNHEQWAAESSTRLFNIHAANNWCDNLVAGSVSRTDGEPSRTARPVIRPTGAPTGEAAEWRSTCSSRRPAGHMAKG
jgi:hypothetical protein